MQTSHDFHTYFIVQSWDVLLFLPRIFSYSIKGPLLGFSHLRNYGLFKMPTEEKQIKEQTSVFSNKSSRSMCSVPAKQDVREDAHNTHLTSTRCHRNRKFMMVILKYPLRKDKRHQTSVQGIYLLDEYYQMQHTTTWHNACSPTSLYCDHLMLKTDCSHSRAIASLTADTAARKTRWGEVRW